MMYTILHTIYTVCYAVELKTQYVIRIVFYIQLKQTSLEEPQRLVVGKEGGRDKGRRGKRVLHASQFQQGEEERLRIHIPNLTNNQMLIAIKKMLIIKIIAI